MPTQVPRRPRYGAVDAIDLRLRTYAFNSATTRFPTGLSISFTSCESGAARNTDDEHDRVREQKCQYDDIDAQKPAHAVPQAPDPALSPIRTNGSLAHRLKCTVQQVLDQGQSFAEPCSVARWWRIEAPQRLAAADVGHGRYCRLRGRRERDAPVTGGRMPTPLPARRRRYEN